MPQFCKSSYTHLEFYDAKHRFEHWYRDNSVLFITSRVSDRSPAFETEQAKRIFWDRFDHYSRKYGYEPWARTLMNNHYHLLGYMEVGENLSYPHAIVDVDLKEAIERASRLNVYPCEVPYARYEKRRCKKK